LPHCYTNKYISVNYYNKKSAENGLNWFEIGVNDLPGTRKFFGYVFDTGMTQRKTG